MNKKAIMIILLIAIFPTFAAISFTSYSVNSVNGLNGPINFQDFPDYYDSSSRMAWDLDIIDKDKVLESHPEVTGEGVYVAVLDTGLVANWKDYFPEERIKTEWGRGFVDRGVMSAIRTDENAAEEKYIPHVVETVNFIADHPHGTHVTSTIIGYTINGIPVQGVAPLATIIPVKVLETYSGLQENFGTDYAIAAGIDYVTGLAIENPESRFIISMSLGSLSLISEVEQEAVDNAIANGVVIVASAGNEGTLGMGSPGSYAPIISVGASGWSSYTDIYGYQGEFIGSWWASDVPEDNVYVSYICDFSSRVNPDLGWDQELDIIAPGSWVVGPYPQGVGQSRLPWWASGNGYGLPGQYYYVGGTSMAAPHVTGVVALMLQINPDLTAAEVESILRLTADQIPFVGSAEVFDPDPEIGWQTITWGYDGLNAVGYGLLQADAVVEYLLS
ncbi:MAG: hypothetical protein EAX90_14635 [Candidatus Heimdallarchaeota archaeon]|nr:hypothetical protein [Candidatus Heimdallarchaeota archaeon]